MLNIFSTYNLIGFNLENIIKGKIFKKNEILNYQEIWVFVLNKKKIMIYVPIWLLITVINIGVGQHLTSHIHRTQAATEKENNLHCYTCDTMEDGDYCVDLLVNHSTSMRRKCNFDEFVCMIKRFSYTTSNENTTSSPKMWSLERKCGVNCEPGCIVIGERTKLYACTSCCEISLCNSGRGDAARYSSLSSLIKFLYINIYFISFLKS